MPRPRFDNLSTERRHDLLERAATEFALHGYEGASLNSILSGAGLSKGVFYYYFDDKADLFATVTDFAMQSVLGPLGDGFDLERLDMERQFLPALKRAEVALAGGLAVERYLDAPTEAGEAEAIAGAILERLCDSERQQETLHAFVRCRLLDLLDAPVNRGMIEELAAQLDAEEKLGLSGERSQQIVDLGADSGFRFSVADLAAVVEAFELVNTGKMELDDCKRILGLGSATPAEGELQSAAGMIYRGVRY